jgi:phage shock protein E
MVILDVREADEYAAGHVKGAINYSVRLLEKGSLPEIPKEEEIITYCRSGARSGNAQNILKQNGFENVKNGGGLEDMPNAGYDSE